eukprot:759349-Hanusia_phi.AAC.1
MGIQAWGTMGQGSRPCLLSVKGGRSMEVIEEERRAYGEQERAACEGDSAGLGAGMWSNQEWSMVMDDDL